MYCMVCRYMKKKPCNLTLVNSSETIQHKRSVGEDGRSASSGQSSPLLQSPFRMTCRSPAESVSDRKGASSIVLFFQFFSTLLCKMYTLVWHFGNQSPGQGARGHLTPQFTCCPQIQKLADHSDMISEV